MTAGGQPPSVRARPARSNRSPRPTPRPSAPPSLRLGLGVGRVHHRRDLLLRAADRDVRVLDAEEAGRSPRTTDALADPGFWSSLGYSFIIGVITVALSIALIVPTAYWVRLRVPRLRPLVEFVTLLPFVIPPVVLVFGLIRVYSRPPAPVHLHRHRQHGAPGLRLRHPVAAVHVPRRRHRAAGDRHPEPHRGRAEPRRRLVHDHRAGHPAEPARRAPVAARS